MNRYRCLILSVTCAIALAGCNDKDVPRQERATAQDTTRMTAPTITDVLARHTPELMKIPGVVGTAEGAQNGRPCILVFVRAETDSLAMAIPSSLEGFAVQIQATGDIKPMH
jgi:hypothetical protein